MLALSVFLDLIDEESDKQKFIRIYETYSNLAVHVAQKQLGNYHFAEEAVQETFTYIAKNMNVLADCEEGEIKGYVLSNLKYFIANTRRVEFKFKKVPIEAVEDSESAFAQSINAYEVLELKQALCSLDEVYRSILEMFYLDGYSCKEIAKMLGISYANARKRLERARECLKYELKAGVRE